MIAQTLTQDKDGKALPAHSYISLNAPVKKIGTDITGIMVFGGFMPAAAAPGAYGVYEPAKVVIDRRLHTEADGNTSIEENWEARTNDGSGLTIQIEFVRGIPARFKVEAKIYSAAKPDFYLVEPLKVATDGARSAPTGVDRVSKFSIKAAGQKLSSLFGGSERLVSITSTPHYLRATYLPDF